MHTVPRGEFDLYMNILGPQFVNANQDLESRQYYVLEKYSETTLRGFAEQNELKLGKVAQPIRAALTGKAVSPGVFDVLNVLGKSESIERIKDQL